MHWIKANMVGDELRYYLKNTFLHALLRIVWEGIIIISNNVYATISVNLGWC